MDEDRVTTESPDSEGFDSSQSTAHLKKRSETAPEARREKSEGGPGKALPKLLRLLREEGWPSRKEAADGARLGESGLGGGWQRSVPTVCSRSKSTFRFAP